MLPAWFTPINETKNVSVGIECLLFQVSIFTSQQPKKADITQEPLWQLYPTKFNYPTAHTRPQDHQSGCCDPILVANRLQLTSQRTADSCFDPK
jgi:hypothetical protein